MNEARFDVDATMPSAHETLHVSDYNSYLLTAVRGRYRPFHPPVNLSPHCHISHIRAIAQRVSLFRPAPPVKLQALLRATTNGVTTESERQMCDTDDDVDCWKRKTLLLLLLLEKSCYRVVLPDDRHLYIQRIRLALSIDTVQWRH